MDVTTSDKFFFFPLNTPAAKSMFYASVIIDDDEYYIGPTDYDELCLYSYTFAIGSNHQVESVQSTVQQVELRGRAYESGTIQTLPSEGDYFYMDVDKDFSFDYKKGTVGLNKDANVITKLYLDD